MDRETEAQRGVVIGSGSHSSQHGWKPAPGTSPGSKENKTNLAKCLCKKAPGLTRWAAANTLEAVNTCCHVLLACCLLLSFPGRAAVRAPKPFLPKELGPHGRHLTSPPAALQPGLPRRTDESQRSCCYTPNSCQHQQCVSSGSPKSAWLP